MEVTVGVDVGGTNTDAAVVSGQQVLGFAKHVTTQDITTGVIHAITIALNNATAATGETLKVERVHIGTTHFVNAVVQRRDLVRVSVIRLCGQASTSLPPFSWFPEHLCQEIEGTVHLVDGGYEFDGTTEISSINPAQIRQVIQEIRAASISNIVIAGIFSPVNNDQEIKVGKIVKSEWAEVSVTLSHQIGQVGLLERENAAVLNEAVRPLCHSTVQAFRSALDQLGLHCPFYLTQNDGTIISASQALKTPVYTFASGPTNSMRGAAFLSGLTNGVVVDIGGTTTDVGILMGGFPREASSKVKIAGVQTNFRMPDVLSIGLGGGSIITHTNDRKKIRVGPDSVGYQLEEQALVFGGEVLTASDMAVAAGLVQFGDPAKVSDMDQHLLASTLYEMRHKVEMAIDQMKFSRDEVPVILVGGGSVLIDSFQPLKGCSSFIKPPHFEVANAVGAALSQVSGDVDYVVNLAEKSRSDAIDEAKARAAAAATAAGALSDTITITDLHEAPLAYLPGNVTRIKVKAVGDLRPGASKHGATWCPDHAASLIATLNKAKPVGKTETHGVTGQSMVGEVEGEVTYDLSYPETEPTIDATTGEWELSHWDIECIAVGAGILGCGGGGSPNNARLRAHRQLQQGKRIRIITPERLEKQTDVNSYIVPVAYMGAPTIWIERLPSDEGSDAVHLFSDLYNCRNYDISGSLQNSDDLYIEERHGLIIIEHYQKSREYRSSMYREGKRIKIVGVTAAEIGGSNGMEALIVGAQLGLPAVDADFMGRAFPELHMSTNYIYGLPPYPVAVVRYGGWEALALKLPTSRHVETIFREICIRMGCAGVWTVPPVTAREVLDTAVLHSLSRAWRLGRAVLHARTQKLSPLQAILQHEGGQLLLTGKIVDVERKTTGGFAQGQLLVEGFGNFQAQNLHINFQNENLIAKLQARHSYKVLACTPDLLTLVDVDTGEPISTESVRYGLRVAVLAMPASPRLTTPQALQVVGPQAFGYPQNEVVYKPFTEYIPHEPVSPV